MGVVTLPANYRDPPVNPKLFGWGDPKLNVSQNRIMERSAMEALPIACTAAQASALEMIPTIEAAIRSKFKNMDSGWNMMICECMAYGLTLEETLMIIQNIGNCVGASHDALLAGQIAHEVVAVGEAEEPLGAQQLAMPFIPFSYGVGRYFSGNMGGGDGSYCSAQIGGTMKYGFLPCFTPGLEKYSGTLPQCSSTVGRLFGSSAAELKKWFDKAIKFDLLEGPIVRNADEAYDMIAVKKHGIQICSGVMPTFWKNDAEYGPLYRMSQPASHSTQLNAAWTYKGKKFLANRNQWGYSAHVGNPFFGIPKGCMVVPIEEIAKWIPRAEAIAIGPIQGLPSNPGA